MPAKRERWVADAAWAIALLGCFACLNWFAFADHGGLFQPLTLTLLAGVLIARLAATRWSRSLVVSGSLSVSMLAVAFVGPAAAFALEWIGELSVWAAERYRKRVLPINLLAYGLPLLVVGTVFAAVAPDGGAGFYLLLAGLSVAAFALNFLIVAILGAVADGEPVRSGLRPFREMAPATAINVVLIVSTAAIYDRLGLGALVFVLASVAAFSYMARLVVAAQERTRQYASLSWGVLSGLLRTLDLRDPRAARHAAAVAAFARDIAKESALSRREQELAHTAGLLHDVGRFGLSDRVMERGTQLTEDDWKAIRRHPELGADLLRDLGMYGPVAEIVRAHHERPDGRGYPYGLKAGDIPEIAKIVAVAEVYDTLTADDTYRSPVSSFQALTELRRVAGTQLDGRYVEALARLLSGRGVEYRHADAADFDEELDMERRVSEAVTEAGAAEPAASDDLAAR